MIAESHVESHVKIYFTREYGTFSFLKGNRDINEAKVKKIVKKIKSGIDILKYAPIIVNEKMEILDGQHRFCVSRELKTNVYYVVSSLMSLDDVPAINSNSSNWANKDYLNSYVDLKKPVYLELSQLLADYPKVNLSIAFQMIDCGHTSSPDSRDFFKDGTLKSDHLETTRELFEMLKAFEPYCDNPFSRRMIQTLDQLKDNGFYNHGLMIEKLRQSGSRIKNISGTTKQIIQELELIVNYRSRKRILIA